MRYTYSTHIDSYTAPVKNPSDMSPELFNSRAKDVLNSKQMDNKNERGDCSKACEKETRITPRSDEDTVTPESAVDAQKGK